MLRFLHFLGMSLWIGGAIAALVLARAVSGRPVNFRVGVWPLLARIHGFVIAPGAILTVLTGMLLTLRLTNQVVGFLGPGMMVMQVAGIVGAVLALFVGLPTANQLALFARLDELTEMPPEAAKLRRRQAIVSTVAGVLAVTALYFGVVGP